MLETGHALMQAETYLKGKEGKALILYGDVPLIQKETLEKLIEKSVNDKNIQQFLLHMKIILLDTEELFVMREEM